MIVFQSRTEWERVNGSLCIVYYKTNYYRMNIYWLLSYTVMFFVRRRRRSLKILCVCDNGMINMNFSHDNCIAIVLHLLWNVTWTCVYLSNWLGLVSLHFHKSISATDTHTQLLEIGKFLSLSLCWCYFYNESFNNQFPLPHVTNFIHNDWLWCGEL